MSAPDPVVIVGAARTPMGGFLGDLKDAPAYALGARITDAFAKYRWCAAIRGAEGGGLVADLPVYTFKTENGDAIIWLVEKPDPCKMKAMLATIA